MNATPIAVAVPVSTEKVKNLENQTEELRSQRIRDGANSE